MNDTHDMLRESVERMLADKVTPRNTLEAEKIGIDRETWQELLKIGVVGSEAAGMEIGEYATVLQAIAYAGALVPYAESEAIGRWLARGAGIESGDGMLAVAVVEVPAVSIQNGSAVLSINGQRIAWMRHAEQMLFSFNAAGRSYVAARPVGALSQCPGSNIAGEPQDVVTADAIRIDAADMREVGNEYGPEAVRARGALCRAVQMLGAMTRVNELTLQYSRDRKQFSRSLSQYQVIQSYLAAMAGELCATAAIVEMALAAAALDPDGDAIEEIAAAKIRAGQAARTITSHGHQVHGAIGFTREYPLNLWTRRLWAWREEYGNEAEWARQLGSIIVGRGADALWPSLTVAVQTGS